jgi:hypothetical protein
MKGEQRSHFGQYATHLGIGVQELDEGNED